MFLIYCTLIMNYIPRPSDRPFSIRLFLPEGSPHGLTIATIPNWAGSVIRCRSTSMPALLARPEASRPGVYILQGPDSSLEGRIETRRAYVGQAGQIRERFPQSAKEREFWEDAVIITTSDPNFSAGHFLALESIIIAEANRYGRVHLDNSVSPRDDAGGLGEADQAEVKTFLDQIKQVLPVLGFEMLRPSIAALLRLLPESCILGTGSPIAEQGNRVKEVRDKLAKG